MAAGATLTATAGLVDSSGPTVDRNAVNSVNRSIDPSVNLSAAVLSRNNHRFQNEPQFARNLITVNELARTGKIDPAAARQLNDIISKLDPKGQAALGQLLTEKPAVLLAQDLNTTRPQSTIDHLHALATARSLASKELNENRTELLSSLVQSLAHDLSNNQGLKSTCSVAALLHKLEEKRSPAEFARLLRGLAVAGTVRLAGGARLDLYRGADLFEAQNHPVHHRSLDNAVLQSALMQLAAKHRSERTGDKFVYHNSADTTVGASGEKFKGLWGEQYDYLARQIFNQNHDRISIFNKDRKTENNQSFLDISLTEAQSRILQQVQDAIKTNQAIILEIKTNVRGHEHHIVCLENISGDQATFFNSWGHRETKSLNELQGMLIAALIPQGQPGAGNLDLRNFAQDASRGFITDNLGKANIAQREHYLPLVEQGIQKLQSSPPATNGLGTEGFENLAGVPDRGRDYRLDQQSTGKATAQNPGVTTTAQILGDFARLHWKRREEELS